MDIKIFKEMGQKCKVIKANKANYDKIMRNPNLVSIRDKKLVCMDICLENEVDLTPFLEIKDSPDDEVQIAVNAFLMATI